MNVYCYILLVKQLDLLVDLSQKNAFKLSHEQKERLLELLCLVKEWNKSINITSHLSDRDIILKDIIDIMYVNMYINKTVFEPSLHESISLLDCACGAGFLGLILSILDSRYKLSFLESNRKKINFVRHASRSLGFKNHQFHHARIEDFHSSPNNSFDLISCRATWDIQSFIKLCSNYVHNNARLIFLAGKEIPELNPVHLSQHSLELETQYSFNILPENYARTVFFLKKTK